MVDTPTTSPFLESMKELSFGSAAGVAGKLFEYPFDTVKVRLQSQPDGAPLKFSGPLDCFKQTWHKEGIRGFFRGISSPLVGAAAENASLFLSYHIFQDLFRSTVYYDLPTAASLPMATLLLCGALSGSATSFILTPIELIKCQMQVQNLAIYDVVDSNCGHSSTLPRSSTCAQHLVGATTGTGTQRRSMTSLASSKLPGALELTLQVYKDHGVSGFWRGQLGTLFRETGGSAAWFGAHEYVSKQLRARRLARSPSAHDDGENTLFESVISGACAGVSYNISLFPADSIKSRMQTEAVLSAGQTTRSASRGFWTVGVEMYRAGGIPVFYRGCGMTVMRSAPSSAIIFLTYEHLKKVWG
ncbi:mitochondrial carrier domain-containing protein [Limtongia smithiae]|uniref:mitochondrial carrier domain-containing protein n=1 Tax=Limtongia smithiae TaxID=1125753 RepID=UPI0034CDBBD4